MRLPKRYGESKETKCPFCSKPAMSISVQQVPVCKNHVDTKLPDIRCACGSWLEMREGKWGPFFLCDRCGPVSFKKGIEMLGFMKPKDAIQTTSPSSTKQATTTKPAPARQPVTQVVRSDDPRFFD
ncbi:MAG: hypothetical protein AABY13_03290 [Nanoarchaeota archaeon]